MATTLLVPGLDGGGEGHWLSWLEAAIPDTCRAVPADPTKLDLSEWSAAVSWQMHRCDRPVFIIAHGFGCLAAVRAVEDFRHRIEGAMLVAPFDPDNLHLGWLLPVEPIGFPATIVASTNDQHMRLGKAAFWAGYWSCDLVNAGRAGSIDQAAGYGPWPAGLSIFHHIRRSPSRVMRGSRGREIAHLSRAI